MSKLINSYFLPPSDPIILIIVSAIGAVIFLLLVLGISNGAGLAVRCLVVIIVGRLTAERRPTALTVAVPWHIIISRTAINRPSRVIDYHSAPSIGHPR